MIGSASKIRNIFNKLLDEGIDPGELARVHAPIGLDLAAETPDEIALCIAAELLMLRRRGTGVPLSAKHQILEDVLRRRSSGEVGSAPVACVAST
jgi:xanthine dehydrogenase accessory factor